MIGDLIPHRSSGHAERQKQTNMTFWRFVKTNSSEKSDLTCSSIFPMMHKIFMYQIYSNHNELEQSLLIWRHAISCLHRCSRRVTCRYQWSHKSCSPVHSVEWTPGGAGELGIYTCCDNLTLWCFVDLLTVLDNIMKMLQHHFWHCILG